MANAGASKDVRWIVCLFSELSEFDLLYASVVAQVVKNLPAMQETQVESLGWENPLEGRHGNPLQYSCLKNPTDIGAWPATVQRLTKSRT